MKYREINIEENQLIARHDLEQHCPFNLQFSNGDNIELNLEGITIGDFNESMAMPEKAVRHDFMEEDGYRVDTSSVIPFGCEPIILRKFEYLGHIIKVTSDVRVKASLQSSVFSIDKLVLSGNWKRVAVINPGEKNCFPDKIKWEEVPFENSTIYESGNMFAILILESEIGMRIEIGTGFDIWRWNIADHIEGAHGNLKVEILDGKVLLERRVLTAESDFEIPKRDWRFNWYLSWDFGENISGKGATTDNCFSLKKFEWPESGRVKKSDYDKEPCLHSKTARNRLRKWLRSIIKQSEGKEVSLLDMEAHICGNAAHLERPKMGELLHWDLPDIFDFQFWANRQLRRNESFLSIFPQKEGIFSELPSFKGMGKPVVDRIDDI